VNRLLKLFWDRVAAVTCVVVAAVMLVVGWVQVSASSDAGEQIPYIMSAGIGGLFLLWIGTTLWLSADLRDEWRKLDVIDESLRHLAAAAPEGPTISLPDDAVSSLPRPAGARQ
jgi:arginine exporter protein ArgO